MTYTGKDIIALGIKPGPHIRNMIERANQTGVCTYESMADLLPPPQLDLQESLSFGINLRARNDDERDNVKKVMETMTELCRTPVIKAAAVMPDACPSGPVGTIPVGGVVASKHIHPGMHSADVCCSVMASTYDNMTPYELMEKVYAATHFGPGGRKEHVMSDDLRKMVRSNPITAQFEDISDWHMGTQGDGNHFSFIGVQESTGKTTLVTHHGSRGFGSRVYKAGMVMAEKYRRKISPATLKQNSWIPNDTEDFQIYMEALKIVAEWTRENHNVLHRDGDFMLWTKHNFVFERGGLIYHAKGSTPAWGGRELIPLNMAEPVLIVEGMDNPNALGFCPHGAGRNFSRSEHKRRGGADMRDEVAGLDVRFWCGKPDESELPSAYKNAKCVRQDIIDYGLAKVVDTIEPYGAIMAGELTFQR